VPVLVGEEIVGCINLTWVAKVASVRTMADKFLPQLREAAIAIGSRMSM
jgi:hypothetical protein